jgi:serine O-acetyltransferase
VQVPRLGRDGLLIYLLRQLESLFPDGHDARAAVDARLDEALRRLARCIDSICMWSPDRFDVLHSTQYSLFLYYLGNTLWRHGDDLQAATKLFLLNKALNGIDCFHEIELPERLFIGHTVGIVLAKASYGERLVLYQNCTVGKNHGIAPVLEDGVVMYAGSAVIGRSRVRAGSVLAQGCSVVNRDTPGAGAVFNGSGGELVFKPLAAPLLETIFRS